jgi:hypothetical protein
MSDQPLTVVRIIAPDFVATFETADGVVRRADSAIAYLVGWTDDEVHELTYSKSWHAAIIFGGPIRVIQHWESFEVLRDGERKNARERASTSLATMRRRGHSPQYVLDSIGDTCPECPNRSLRRSPLDRDQA